MHTQTTPDTLPCAATSSLANRLGTVPHLSALLGKARSLGLGQPQDLEKLAVQRGLRYYDAYGDSTKFHSDSHETSRLPGTREFSNEELSLALLSPTAPYSLQRLRMGAAMLAAEGSRPEHIASLARRERSEAIVRHIATCGSDTEPHNPFWKQLLDLLPATSPPRPDILPHPTRFVAMSGISRAGKRYASQWIRPIRPPTA